MIKTSKDIIERANILHISTKVELESDGSLVLLTMSDSPMVLQRFTFTPSEAKKIAEVVMGKRKKTLL